MHELDSDDLNKAIICEHHKCSVLEEVTYRFSGLFPKADGYNRFWSAHPNDEPPLLTAFNTYLGPLPLSEDAIQP